MYCHSIPNILLTICLLQRDKREPGKKIVLISHRNKSAEKIVMMEKYYSFGAGTTK
jgi:hypothetical protein